MSFGRKLRRPALASGSQACKPADYWSRLLPLASFIIQLSLKKEQRTRRCSFFGFMSHVRDADKRLARVAYY